MNRRNLKLDKHGISKKRYKELCGFCEQYPEWKQTLKGIDLLPSKELDGMPSNPNKGQSDVVGNMVAKIDTLREKCGLIERTAQKASADLWRFIIKSVCYEVPITYLLMVDEMPCGKTAFYEARRYFFYLLDIEKKKLEHKG